jgi:hypothetical protein
LNGVIEYNDGATFLGSAEGWEDKIEQGEGWSYGTELLLRKTTGKTTGWLGYTLSWSERKFEEINFGNKFPFRYDQRHDISFVVVHKLSKNIDAGLTWVYGSGNAVTLQTQKFLSKDNPYSIDNNNEINYFNSRNNYRMGVVNYFKSRNNYRMPAYHRMDISINFHKEKKHGTRTWKLGLYNTYNHQNPFFLYYGYAEAENKTNSLYNSNKVLKQFSLLPILPSLSYSYKF